MTLKEYHEQEKYAQKHYQTVMTVKCGWCNKFMRNYILDNSIEPRCRIGVCKYSKPVVNSYCSPLDQSAKPSLLMGGGIC